MPSETPEPTQERADKAQRVFYEALRAAAGSEGAIIAAYAAAEAAPLREEIERLGSENEDLRDRLSEQPSAAEEILLFQQQRDAAEANVLSLEAEIEKLAARTGEMHREKTNAETEIERQHELYVGAADDTQHERRKALILEKKLAEALAAASRAKEDQEHLGALRAALEAADRLITGVYRDWETSGGPDVCEHGYAAGIPCERCDHATFNAALAPPAAESQENQQQLTGKGQ